MDKNKIGIILLLGTVFVSWGGYKIANASYTALTWEKTEGTIVDFEHHVWSCGKGVGECYSLVAGYHAGKDYFTTVSDKKFNYKKPVNLLDDKVIIYYSPTNHSIATFGGEYGPMNGGIIMFMIGTGILAVFWFIREKE